MDPSVETRIKNLEHALGEIQQRNLRVESDKKWEVSWLRRGAVAGLTFFFASVVFVVIDVPNPLRNALIPVTGYIVSTFSLPWLRGFLARESGGES